MISSGAGDLAYTGVDAVLLASAGLILIGIGAWLRRRRSTPIH